MTKKPTKNNNENPEQNKENVIIFNKKKELASTIGKNRGSSKDVVENEPMVKKLKEIIRKNAKQLRSNFVQVNKMEIQEDIFRKKVEEVKKITTHQLSDGVKDKYSNTHEKVRLILVKIQKSIRSGKNYTTEEKGLYRGDEFIDDLYNLFDEISKSLSEREIKDIINESDVNDYKRLLSTADYYLKAMHTNSKEKGEWERKIIEHLNRLGIFEGIRVEDAENNTVFQRGLTLALSKTKKSIENERGVNYSDSSKYLIRAILIRQIDGYIDRNNFDKAIKLIKIAIYNTLTHQMTISKKVERKIGKKKDSTYYIDEENSENPFNTNLELNYYLEQIVDNLRSLRELLIRIH